jgi:hypothetical protein
MFMQQNVLFLKRNKKVAEQFIQFTTNQTTATATHKTGRAEPARPRAATASLFPW